MIIHHLITICALFPTAWCYSTLLSASSIKVDIENTTYESVALHVYNKNDPRAVVDVTWRNLEKASGSTKTRRFRGVPGEFTIDGLDNNTFYGFSVRATSVRSVPQWSSTVRKVARTTMDSQLQADDLRQLYIFLEPDRIVLRASSDQTDKMTIQLQLSVDCPNRENRKYATLVLDKDHPSRERIFELHRMMKKQDSNNYDNSSSKDNNGDDNNKGDSDSTNHNASIRGAENSTETTTTTPPTPPPADSELQYCVTANEGIWIKPINGGTSFRVLKNVHYVEDLEITDMYDSDASFVGGSRLALASVLLACRIGNVQMV